MPKSSTMRTTMFGLEIVSSQPYSSKSKLKKKPVTINAIEGVRDFTLFLNAIFFPFVFPLIFFLHKFYYFSPSDHFPPHTPAILHNIYPCCTYIFLTYLDEINWLLNNCILSFWNQEMIRVSPLKHC